MPSKKNKEPPSAPIIEDNDDFMEATKELFPESDDAELDGLSAKELDKRVSRLPTVLDIVPEEPFKCINNSYCRRIGMTEDDIISFMKRWGVRIVTLQRYHRHCLEIIKRRYPDQYQVAIDGGVDLTWGTMMKRFSTDVNIYATDHKTFYHRMLHYININRSRPTRSLKRARDNDGDDNDDDDDNDSDVCDITPKRSKLEARAKENRPPASSNKKKQKTKQANDSSSLASSSSSASSSMSSSARVVSIGDIDDMRENINSLLLESDADEEHINKLFQTQIDIKNYTSAIWRKMYLRISRAGKQIDDLRRHYVSMNRKLDDLVRNSLSIISTLYHSYIQMAIDLHSVEWWRDPPRSSGEYSHRVLEITNSLHPQPAALRDRSSYIFGSHQDVMSGFRLDSREDVETVIESGSRYESCNTSLSVFRFSEGLRRQLEALDRIPPNGNILVNQEIPDPEVHRQFTVECNNIMSADASNAFNHVNDQLYETTKAFVGAEWSDEDNNENEGDGNEGVEAANDEVEGDMEGEHEEQLVYRYNR